VERESRFHLRAHAIDMDMQLILTAAEHRVDGHANVLARDPHSRSMFEIMARVPSRLPVIGAARRLELRAFDSRNLHSRNEQHFGCRLGVSDDGVAAPPVHLQAWGRRTAQRHVDYAKAMDDAPKGV